MLWDYYKEQNEISLSLIISTYPSIYLFVCVFPKGNIQVEICIEHFISQCMKGSILYEREYSDEEWKK